MPSMPDMPEVPPLTYDCVARETCPPMDADSVIKILSRAVARSQNQCLAQAMNFILIQVIQARNINIQDMQVMQRASATARCSQQVDVDMGSMQYEIQQALAKSMVIAKPTQQNVIDAVIAALTGRGGNTGSTSGANPDEITKMITDVSNSFGTDEMNLCVATAVNQFRLTIEDVSEDVNIKGLNIDQLAQAEVLNCLQAGSVKVGDVPLRTYLNRQIQKMPNVRLLSLPGSCPDPAILNKYYFILFGFVAFILFCTIMFAIVI